MSKKCSKNIKRFSLIEIFAAITLMLIISTTLIVNFKGSFERGKEFRSKEGAKQVYRALMLEANQMGQTSEEVVENWENIVKSSPILPKKTPSNDPAKDGWQHQYMVDVVDGNIVVKSPGYEEMMQARNVGYEQDESQENYWE